MTIPYTRTSDQTLRALQWARSRDMTSELIAEVEHVRMLRAAIHALKAALAWEWQFDSADLELCAMLKKRIASRVDALKLATDALSSIQSELESLQTALDDNYEVTDATRQ